MSKGSGTTRGDRRRNERRERLRRVLPRDGAVIGIDLAEEKQLPGLLLAPLAGFPERGHPGGLATDVEPAQDEVEGARHHGLGVLIAEDAAGRARVSSSRCTWALPSSPAIPALSPRRRVRAKLPPSTSIRV
jgi:hypothetical protein